jgi:hypothetical protein
VREDSDISMKVQGRYKEINGRNSEIHRRNKAI